MMFRIRTIIAVVVLLALAGGIAAYLFRGSLALALMRTGLARGMMADLAATLPDGLAGALCGSGSPFPDQARAGPCFAVVAGGKIYLVDAGSGGSEVLTRMGLQPGRIAAVFLTHFHSDHIDGLGEVMIQRWAGGAAAEPLALIGPQGVEQIAEGFNTAYRMDAGYRVAHHGPEVVPPSGAGFAARPFDVPKTLVPEAAAPVEVFRDGALVVTAFRVDHAPAEPAVGYRFAYKGRAIVISGDTNRVAAVAQAAKGADVLVHEALSAPLLAEIGAAANAAGRSNVAKIMTDIVTYHTSPEDAARVAEEAGVPVLILTHLVPPLPLSALEGPFLGGARDLYSGRLELGADGLLVTLPAGTRDIDFDWR